MIPTTAPATPEHGAVTPRLVVLPIQNRAGNQLLAAELDFALRQELQQTVSLVGASPARDALRSQRMRNADLASPEVLQEITRIVDANWLLSVTLHDADPGDVPSITVSVRLYDGANGQTIWAAAETSTGLESRTVFGIGTRTDLSELTRPVAVRLTKALEAALGPRNDGLRRPTWVLVPFAGLTKRESSKNAETVTELVRAAADRHEIRLVSPNRVNALLRNHRFLRWGGIPADLRVSLRQDLTAGAILTGAVERYDTGGRTGSPDPGVAISMRLVDSTTGQILWTDAMEKRGSDYQSLLQLGRIHSRGALAQRIVETLFKRLSRQHTVDQKDDGDML